MTWETLAPWMALVFTLALSILVPFFNQKENHRFLLKKETLDRELAEKDAKFSKRVEAYEHFLMDVGAAMEYRNGTNVPIAGASIARLYLYTPEEWWTDLDKLHRCLYNSKWEEAETQFLELAKMVSEEYQKINI